MPLESVPVIDDDSVSRGERAFRTLYEAIMAGQIQPGVPIPEEAAARHLGMSRTPVREALRRLRTLGLVKEAGTRGFVVTEISPERAIEAFAVREVLEMFCGRLAAQRVSTGELLFLQNALQQMNASLDDADAASQWDRVFHQYLYDFAHNSVLREIMETLTLVIDQISDVGYDMPGRIVQAIAEHQRVIDALAAHDVDAAEAAIRDHLRNGLNARLAVVRELGQHNSLARRRYPMVKEVTAEDTNEDTNDDGTRASLASRA